jgi:hypothetical protein
VALNALTKVLGPLDQSLGKPKGFNFFWESSRFSRACFRSSPTRCAQWDEILLKTRTNGEMNLSRECLQDPAQGNTSRTGRGQMADVAGGKSKNLIPSETFRLQGTQTGLPAFEVDEGPASEPPKEWFGVGNKVAYYKPCFARSMEWQR